MCALDIFVVIGVSRLLAVLMRKKGYGSLHTAPAVAGWILGEVLGFGAAAAAHLGPVAYVTAYGGAVVGCALGIAYAVRLPAREVSQ